MSLTEDMDYKTNVLQQEVEIDGIMFQELPDLHFGVINGQIAVFDFTEYIESNGIESMDYKKFMRLNKHYIETISKSYGKPTSMMFYQNTNGHILVAAELAFLFLAFVDPDMCLYFNSALAELMDNGISYSQSFIYKLAEERLPLDILKDIIKNKTDEQEQERDQQHTLDAAGI